jgi:Skp family chaperone for outer membrane proteins
MPDILEPKAAPAAPPAAPTSSPLPAAPSSTAGTPAAAPPSPAPAQAAGDDNPYNEVDAAFTKAGMPDPDKAKPAPAPKDAKPSAAPAKPIPTAADKAPGVPKELRAELDRVKAELKSKADSHAALEAKITDWEKRGKDTTVLTTQLETERKEKEELKAQLRRARKEVDPEFVQKYEVPFNRASSRAKAAIEQIQVEDSETGQVRTSSWSDFTKIYYQNEFIATKEAKRLFGEDGAGIAMGYYRELHRLDDDKRVALDTVQAKWKEEEQAEQAKAVEEKTRQEKFQEQVNDDWTKLNAALVEKVDDYHDSPDDAELADVRAKTLAIYDAPSKTFKDKMLKDGHTRHRVGAFPVLKIKLARALKELADIKAENEGLRESPPGKARRPGGSSAGAHEETLEEALRKIQ